jgi:SAM-dependent methyltransferase
MADLSQIELVSRVNRLPYPPTVFEQGWIYGVWYCGTSFQKAIYYGQYPGTFVKRVMSMFQGQDILHLCCGRCHISGAINVDFHPLPEADIVANVESLPFKDNSFDMALIDPPYSDLDAERYKVPRLVSSKKVMRECLRVLRPGGWLLWLDEKYPSYSRHEWALKGLIGIVTGFERRARLLSFFQVPEPSRQMKIFV